MDMTVNHDLVMRLRCRYPVGPLNAEGEPEFGWRNTGGPMSVTLPTPIMLEAADEITRLRAEVERLEKEQAAAAEYCGKAEAAKYVLGRMPIKSNA